MKIAYDPEDDGRILWVGMDHDTEVDYEHTTTIGENRQTYLPETEEDEGETAVYYYDEETGDITVEYEEVSEEDTEESEDSTTETEEASSEDDEFFDEEDTDDNEDTDEDNGGGIF